VDGLATRRALVGAALGVRKAASVVDPPPVAQSCFRHRGLKSVGVRRENQIWNASSSTAQRSPMVRTMVMPDVSRTTPA
jgi:hypothetical protein